MGYLGIVKIDGTSHKIGSTLYGTCATEAATAAKVVTCSDFTELPTGVTIHVKFTYSNTATNPTLNINSKGAKPIYRYGTTVPGTNTETSWNAGAVVSFTYDGTNFIMNDWLNASTWDSITGKPSTFPPSAHTHDYLPLAGGTMSGSIKFPQDTYGIISLQNSTSNYTALVTWYKGGTSQATYNPQIGQHNTGNTTGAICILPYATETTPWGGSVGLYIGKGVLKLDGKHVARFTTTATANQVLVASDTTGGIKTSGYTIATSVPSNAVFTDVNVTQTATTTDANYEVLFSATADNTTRTETARKNSNLTFNPSTGTLTLPIITSGTANIDTANITEDNVGNLIVTGAARFLNTINGSVSGTSSNVTGTVAIANGGTGATTRLGAAQNLTNESVASPTHVVGLTTNWGKFGYTTIAQLKTAIGYDTTVTSGSSNLITSGAVAQAIDNLPEPMIFKGTLGTNGTITTLPTASASNEGYTYKVITAGTYASQAAKVGDVFVCAELTSGSYSWVIIPAGDTDSDSWRNIKINGTEKLTTVISSGAIDFVNGTNTTVSFNATGNKIQVDAVDTKYALGISGNNVILKKDGTTQDTITVPYATSAGSATKATQDSDGNVINTTYLKLSGGNMTGTSGIQFPIASGNNKTGNWISAGGGYSTGSGKSGVKIVSCEQSDCVSGLGQDLSGLTGGYEMNVVAGLSTSGSGYISFVGHKVSTPTTYTRLGYFDGNGDLHVSRYLFANYLNQSSNAETPTSSSYWMYCNSDGYLRKSSLANLKSQIGIGDYLPLSGGTLTGADCVFYTANNTTKINANSLSILQSPIPKYLWHDLFGFNRYGTPTYYVTADGSTWTEATLDKSHFAELENVGENVIKAEDQCGARWVWYHNSFAWSGGTWLVIGVGYASPSATVTITFESSTDTSAWTLRHQSTHSDNSAPIWCKIDGYGSSKYLRLTITKDPSDTTKYLNVGSIRLLTARWGSQGGGVEFEYPYSWDADRTISTLHLRPTSNNIYDLGTTSLKWANVYATTFHGALDGNATTATTASNLSGFENNNSSGKNANSVTYNAHTYYTSNGPATSIGASTGDGALYAQAYSTTWVGQIAQDYRDGSLFVRGKNNGTWQNWLAVLDSGNIGYNMTSTVSYDPHNRRFITSKSTSAWDAQAYSQYGYADAVYVTFKPNQTNMAMMIGLDSNPSEDANYNKIDYALYCMNNGKVSIYESGTERGVGSSTYAAGDEFKVEYVGGYVRYYQNGTLLREVARSISGKLYMDSSFHGATSCIYDVEFGCTTTNAKYAANAGKATQDSDGNAINSTYLKKSGGTMTGQILTSFKYAVAMGSRVSDAATIPDLCEDLRYSSGCCGSVSIGTAYTLNNITIAKGWYNYLWVPHRSGGNSGAASGDNCNYGSLYLSGMTLSGCYMIRYASAAIAELRNLYADNNTTYGLGTSGNNITIVAGGTTTSITAPYATSAGNASTVNNLTVQTAVPANAVFTDQNVNQSATTTANWRKIVLSYQDSASAGTAVTTNTNVVYVTPNAEIQPSTGNIRSAGQMSASTMLTTTYGVNQSNGTSGGISLYSGTGYVANYGIAFRTTANMGKHGYVQSDWATYLTMDGADTRGWVFRNAASGKGNVASISSAGNMVLNGSLTIGGNATNTSGMRLVWSETTQSLDFVVA